MSHFYVILGGGPWIYLNLFCDQDVMTCIVMISLENIKINVKENLSFKKKKWLKCLIIYI